MIKEHPNVCTKHDGMTLADLAWNGGYMDTFLITNKISKIF